MKILLHSIKVLFLLPLSLLYASAIFLRNKFFDWGFHRSTSFPFPVICVGNITVGGTGKTPHIEYLLRAISDYTAIAMLSRGYKRQSKGFRLVEANSTPHDVGDEPFQVKSNFPAVTVAVDANRTNGINQLVLNNPGLQVVLLDDAFQHRKVTPSFSIVLVDYNRPVDKDWFLPLGHLRDSRSQLRRRAQVVIVTKCPAGLTKEEQNKFRYRLKLNSTQLLCFSTVEYSNLIPIFDAPECTALNALAVTGIANPKPFVAHLQPLFAQVGELPFADHHFFTSKDIENIVEQAAKLSNTAIITTQKDAVRFRVMGDQIPLYLQQKMYYIPIQVRFIAGEEDFLTTLYHHVNSNSGNSKLYKK